MAVLPARRSPLPLPRAKRSAREQRDLRRCARREGDEAAPNPFKCGVFAARLPAVRARDTLMAQRFDADRLELKGDAFPIAEQAARNPLNGRAFFSVSENGRLALRTGDLALNQLIWFDRTGKQLGALTPPGNYSAPSLSPDEKTVAVSRVDSQGMTTSDIWLIDLERGAQMRIPRGG